MDMDYEALGFKAGLEIHQQLDTKKLFCNCPSLLRQDQPDFTVKRKLHVVAGESGEVDIAAKQEAEKERTFVYEGYNDTTCLIELDEEPPREINPDSLKIALQIAFFLNAKIFPLSQIMRKTVVDGSNTAGFQRSVLIARDGWLITKSGRVGIESICLEEDAARIVERKQDSKTNIFRLDRLGIPLIEIATSPDMKNPEHVKEVALYIGKILRSCKVKRGIGTIRQDINVSIKGGNRVEIKGFQDPRMMTKTIEKEIQRQLALLSSGKYIREEVRNALPNGDTEFLRPLPGAARMYPETDLPLLKISRQLINEIKKSLPQLREDAEKELKSQGLSDELIKLVLERYLSDFKELLKIFPQQPMLIAKMLTIWRSELATRLKKPISSVERVVNMDILAELLDLTKKGEISSSQIRHIFSELAEGMSLEDIIKKPEAEENVEEKIMKLIKSKPGLSENAYMGLVMKEPELKGKISGKEASEIIKKLLNK